MNTCSYPAAISASPGRTRWGASPSPRPLAAPVTRRTAPASSRPGGHPRAAAHPPPPSPASPSPAATSKPAKSVLRTQHRRPPTRRADAVCSADTDTPSPQTCSNRPTFEPPHGSLPTARRAAPGKTIRARKAPVVLACFHPRTPAALEDDAARPFLQSYGTKTVPERQAFCAAGLPGDRAGRGSRAAMRWPDTRLAPAWQPRLGRQAAPQPSPSRSAGPACSIPHGSAGHRPNRPPDRARAAARGPRVPSHMAARGIVQTARLTEPERKRGAVRATQARRRTDTRPRRHGATQARWDRDAVARCPSERAPVPAPP